MSHTPEPRLHDYAPHMARVALFLRGINVGRAKRIAMSDLAAMVADLGATDVRTLLNSGNVVCTSRRSPQALASGLSDLVEARCGFTASVVPRTSDEVDAALARDPLGHVADDPARYLVTFLDVEPAAEAVTALGRVDAGDERWELVGRELYLWLPAGTAQSVVSAALARGVLGVTWTARNWSTVTKVQSLLRQ